MNEFIHKETGKKVSYGDILKITINSNTSWGPATTIVHATVNEDTVEDLIKKGILERTPVEDRLPYFKERLRKRLKLDKEVFYPFMDALLIKEPFIAARLIIKEVALKRYRGTSEVSKYCVAVNKEGFDIIYANIWEFDDKRVVTFFDTLEDAKEALEIVAPIIRYGKQEDKKCSPD